MMFTMEGHEVFVADDGDKAFNLAEQQLPDVIVTDLRLPGAGWNIPWKAYSVKFEIR